MAVAEVDLEMDDLFGDGQDVEELLDQPAEQRELDDEAQEVPGPGEGQTQGNICPTTYRSFRREKLILVMRKL